MFYLVHLVQLKNIVFSLTLSESARQIRISSSDEVKWSFLTFFFVSIPTDNILYVTHANKQGIIID